MRELVAIDPGPTESAVVELRSELDRPIWKAEKLSNEAMLAVLRERTRWGKPDFAIEMIASYGMAVGREVFETCLWVGRYIQVVGAARLVYRAEVKMHLCHSMKAKDANIRQALIDKFGPPGTKKNPGRTYGLSGDMWSALAVGVTAMETPCPPENLRR